jgi:hypothetical protein
MLKPADPGPQSERPIGELVSELIDEGKAYARAEFALAKAIAAAKGKALAWPAGLFLLALIVVQSAVTILAVGIFMALVGRLGPILSAIVASLLFLGIAGAIGWHGYQRLRRGL